MKGGGGWTVSKGPPAWGCFEEDGRGSVCSDLSRVTVLSFSRLPVTPLMGEFLDGGTSHPIRVSDPHFSDSSSVAQGILGTFQVSGLRERTTTILFY